MWLGQMKIFRTMLCTLCQNYLSFIICNYRFSLLTGHDLCHSQPMLYYFIISNTSCSINLFELSRGSSPLKVLLLLQILCYYMSLTVNYLQPYCCHATWIAWDVLHVMSNVTGITGNLCNKCPKRLVEQNSSCSDYFNAISGFTLNSRAPGGPVTTMFCYRWIDFYREREKMVKGKLSKMLDHCN